MSNPQTEYDYSERLTYCLMTRGHEGHQSHGVIGCPATDSDYTEAADRNASTAGAKKRTQAAGGRVAAYELRDSPPAPLDLDALARELASRSDGEELLAALVKQCEDFRRGRKR